MNKYKFRLPYDFLKFGEVVGYVYADNEEQALDRLHNTDYWVEEEHIDRYDGDTNYDHSEIELDEEEEDVDYDYRLSYDDNTRSISHGTIIENDILPPYFLAELHLV